MDLEVHGGTERPDSSSLTLFKNLYSKRPAAAAAGSVKFHTSQRNEKNKKSNKVRKR